MTVKVGSARSDERGKDGWDGKSRAGDQKNGLEVSTQDWYLHSKGWVVIRAKDATVREKIAYAMQRACDNNNVGYDQSQRDTAWDWCSKNGNWDPGAINVPVETDCSSLVKLCCRYAGINITKYFVTSNETEILKATGKFDILTDDKYTKSSDYLLRGDILNTRSSGHTVVVLNDGAKAKSTGKYVYDGVVYDDVFDPYYYIRRYDDLMKAFCPVDRLLQHYVNFGIKEHRVAKEPTKKLIVLATDCWLRNAPTLKNEARMIVIPKGKTVEVQKETSAENRTWAYVTYAGKTGWLSERYTKVVQ